MNTKTFVLAGSLAILAAVSVALTYFFKFGPYLSDSREEWGQFGDYFAGILNPIFSALAFFALLLSIRLQDTELKSTAKRLATQAGEAQAEIQRIHTDRMAQELLLVIRDIDARIDLILNTVVSHPGTFPQITIAQLNAEANRLALTSGQSGAYAEFLELAKSEGSTIEATTRDLIYLITSMESFLKQYAGLKDGKYAPSIRYYASKVCRIIQLVEDVGGAMHFRGFFTEACREN